ncbi:uncharacterized protein BYT42DRAFT_554932 [Radiomyces spectabilis]|uniref:uncharacterized protein n=1 Tax=Radiomyces spectabilis TaxID=64574 RepID=UPI00221FEDD5|nr:uncharacterized protein BYT42DRAFT_554932 [Radiomyces spectabilis]KAI8390935.1 hypothetical protein BYT42DRAFT_554932 [Radiomyces spectabilis]
MSDLASSVLSVAMVLAPVIGYVDQYLIIRKNRSSAGFNSLTCAILLFANILRVFFWFGKRFDTTLLVQSIVMIIAQLVLLEAVIRYKPDFLIYRRASISSMSSESSIGSSLLSMADRTRWWGRISLWGWPHYLDYINCLLAFTTLIGILYVFLHPYPVFIEVIGAISLGIESTLPLPQCLSNFTRRSTSGFSLLVLGSWFLGDGFKVFYFIYTQAPLQFDICGAIQLTVDTVIVFQFIIFSSTVKKWLGISAPNVFEDDHDGAGYQTIS